MGYTIELSVLHELSLRGETAASASVLAGEAPGSPPSLVKPDPPLLPKAADTSAVPSPSPSATA
jgi:hypothetical protein